MSLFSLFWFISALYHIETVSSSSDLLLSLSPLYHWEYDLSLSRNTNDTLLICSNNAIITFIMPTSGSRSTILSSITSLRSLNSCYWRLIVVYSSTSSVVDQLQIYPPIQLSRFSMSFENDPRIFYLPFQRKSLFNYGGSSRNAAIRHCQTEWIGFLDDDDEISPDYLMILKEELKYHPNISAILFRMSCENCYANIIPPYPYPSLIPGYSGRESRIFISV